MNLEARRPNNSLFPTRLRTGVAARRLTTRSGHRSAAAPHSRALGGAAQLTIVRLHSLKYYQDFSPTLDSFEDRIGPPEEFDAVMGRIALGFSFLEDTARNLIVLFSKTESKK